MIAILLIVTDETLGEAQGHEAAHAAAKLLNEAQQAEVRAFMGIFEKFNENVVRGRQSAYHENVMELLAPSLHRAVSKTPDSMLGGGALCGAVCLPCCIADRLCQPLLWLLRALSPVF